MYDERDDPRGPAGGRRGGDMDVSSVAKREALAAEIAERLRRVCSHLSEAQFRQLVGDIVATRRRFAEIDAGSSVSRPKDGPAEGS